MDHNYNYHGDMSHAWKTEAYDGSQHDTSNVNNPDNVYTDAVENYGEDSHNNTGGGACHNCGQEGHFSRECPEPRKQGACFNCGESGHTKAECTKPRVFKGTCNICSEEGHPAAQCPSKPKLCARCKQVDDHETKDCKNNFYLDLNDIADMPEGAAWTKIVNSSLYDDLDDFKTSLRILQKSAPHMTYLDVEKKMRTQNLRYYLIGLKKEASEGYTLVDLQGVPDKTFSIAICKSPHCQRPNMVAKWPESAEENLSRLADAGVPMERGIPYCRNCSSFGHNSRACDQEKLTADPKVITCALCNEEGHRVRDCTEPRKQPRGEREPMACRVCGGEHMAKDCDQKPVMRCRNCDQEGHKASECTEPRKIKCNNCDEEGHISKECTKPKDWDRVTCRHCGEKGHAAASRCAPGAAKIFEESSADAGSGGMGNYDNEPVVAANYGAQDNYQNSGAMAFETSNAGSAAGAW